MSATYDKGLKFEELVGELFRSKGYNVKHNVKLTGRSGVQHQIDVYAEYKAPLHTSRLIIECKAYDKPVNKDMIMKLIYEVQDLGVDKGILVTTSYFTPDAEDIAKGYPIELIEWSKLRECFAEVPEVTEVSQENNIYHIEPFLSAEKAKKLVKGEVVEENIIYCPLYEVDVEVLTHKETGFIRKKTKEVLLNIRLLVDPTITNSILHYDESKGLLVVMRLLKSLKLPRDELEALKALSMVGRLSVPALASRLSWSIAKARKALQGLVTLGLVKVTKIDKTSYYCFEKPALESLRSIPEQILLVSGKPNGVCLEPMMSKSDVKESLEALWNLRVKAQRTIYWPYYVAKLTRKGVQEVKVIDLVRKNEVKWLAGYFARIILLSGT